jgi:hypothetical protein
MCPVSKGEEIFQAYEGCNFLKLLLYGVIDDSTNQWTGARANCVPVSLVAAGVKAGVKFEASESSTGKHTMATLLLLARAAQVNTP